MPNHPAPRRILVIRNDRVGDLILTLPTLEALRAAFPSAHMTLLASRYAGPLVAGHPAIDELLLDDPADGVWKLARRLTPGRYDAALVLNTTTRTCLAVRVARIRRRVCWAYKPAGRLTATHPVKLHRSRPPVHEARFALAFAERLGVPFSGTIAPPRMPICDTARAAVRRQIAATLGSDGPLIGVHPGNKQSAYNWPIEQYAELVARLAPRARVLLTGGPDEVPLLEAACSRLSAAQRKRVAAFNNFTLPELVAALDEVSVLVVSSTGPMHVAGAVGTPTVALFSPNPVHAPAKWAPLGDHHTLLLPRLADTENPDVPHEEGRALMARISVDEVEAAVGRYLKNGAMAA